MALSCPICAAQMREVTTRTILRQHLGQYDFCGGCGFMRVRDPSWLEEAYSDAIASTDTGIVMRNIMLADRLEALLPKLDEARGPYLDFGGGVGLLVRLMRDRGFDFRWQDSYADNALARGFEYDLATDGPALAVTAMEVLEHVTDPVAFVDEALKAGQSRTLIFTTVLFAGDPPQDWWYYSTATGQHISFFRRDTLQALGARLGLRLVSDGGLHMLTDRPVAEAVIATSGKRLPRIAARVARRKRGSLTQSDHDMMVARSGGADA